MDLTLVLAVFVMLMGLFLYLFSAPPKFAEIGRIMFAFGLLASLLKFSGHASLHVGYLELGRAVLGWS